MIAVKEAVKIAMKFVMDLYENYTPPDLLLEEVRLSDDEKHWLITIGFSRNALSSFVGKDDVPRAYKLIKIDAETGEPIEMTIRTT